MKAVHAWVRKYEKNGLIGFADVLFALAEGEKGCLTIRDFSVFRNDNGGIRVSFPSKQDKDGEWRQKMNINVETPECQALLDSITECVAIAFATADRQTIDNNQPNSNTQDSQPKAMNNEEKPEIPF